MLRGNTPPLKEALHYGYVSRRLGRSVMHKPREVEVVAEYVKDRGLLGVKDYDLNRWLSNSVEDIPTLQCMVNYARVHTIKTALGLGTSSVSRTLPKFGSHRLSRICRELEDVREGAYSVSAFYGPPPIISLATACIIHGYGLDFDAPLSVGEMIDKSACVRPVEPEAAA